MKTIVGLGNPGHTFHGTRHNIGFDVIQLLATRHNVSLTERLVSPVDGRPAAVFGEYDAPAQTVQLVMPLTMMNESGEAARALQALPQDVLIVCDDVNLPLGAIRLRPDGGPGGHHGLQSCLEALGTEGVPRLRFGVGVAELPKDLREFVLTPFHSTERPLVKQIMEQAADACELWVNEGMDVAMNRFNRVQTS